MQKMEMTDEELKSREAFNTASEISQQPELFLRIYDQVKAERKKIKDFFDNYLPESDEIILTGAGTSSFIGLSLKGSFFKHMGIHTESIPTTELVTHPCHYFSSKSKVILFSFARSGNSPESIAAVEFAENLCAKVYHVIITCNVEGNLATFDTRDDKLVITLPPESNDKGLAMTSSYTGMLLAGLLISRIDQIEKLSTQVHLLKDYARDIINQDTSTIKKYADERFQRAVYLGSGPLLGTAFEGHLKLQEMTDGEVICKKDSYLGFRHGPKAVINEHTALIYILSNRHYSAHYEDDLITSIENGDQNPKITIGIFEQDPRDHKFDLPINLSKGKNNENLLEEDFLPVCSIIPLQILAFFKSLNLGYKPDNPSKSGAISRVVEGVKIYPLEQTQI